MAGRPHLMMEALRGTQRHSEALRGAQKHSEALRGTHLLAAQSAMAAV